MVAGTRCFFARPTRFHRRTFHFSACTSCSTGGSYLFFYSRTLRSLSTLQPNGVRKDIWPFFLRSMAGRGTLPAAVQCTNLHSRQS